MVEQPQGDKLRFCSSLSGAINRWHLLSICSLSIPTLMHALSIPTWIIHTSSVIEWVVAIWLISRYAEVTHNRSWYGVSFAMLPALVSAMCACTWHFFDNAPRLDWLVVVQAATTLIGNITLMLAAWGVWRSARKATDLQLNSLVLPILLLLPPASIFSLSKENLFAFSLFPYLGFLWFLTQSRLTPRLALIGFYMTLVFVAITIPAGIYAKAAYGAELANVDWLHGSAEFFLTLANILVVLGFRQALSQHQTTDRT